MKLLSTNQLVTQLQLCSAWLCEKNGFHSLICSPWTTSALWMCQFRYVKLAVNTEWGCVRVFHFSAEKILFCELLSCCERVKVILESGVRPQESSGLCIACNLSMWEGVWRQFLVNVATVWFLWNQQNDETPRREIPFLRQVFKIWKMCVYALCIKMWKTYKLAEGWKQLMVVTQSSFHVLWQRELIQFHRKSSNKTIIWLSCPFLFHDFLPHVTKRSLQNTWLNHPLLYKSSWMGITNPVFVQLHFLECFSQASARDSVYIVYRVCKCYQLFEKSIKCYKEHLQILASSHIAKDVEC